MRLSLAVRIRRLVRFFQKEEGGEFMDWKRSLTVRWQHVVAGILAVLVLLSQRLPATAHSGSSVGTIAERIRLGQTGSTEADPLVNCQFTITLAWSPNQFTDSQVRYAARLDCDGTMGSTSMSVWLEEADPGAFHWTEAAGTRYQTTCASWYWWCSTGTRSYSAAGKTKKYRARATVSSTKAGNGEGWTSPWWFNNDG